jgi:type IV pilus assembly protein PilM
MARGHRHVVGLDIGSSAIKAVELKRSGSAIELIGRPAVVPTPPRSVEGGVIVDTTAVAGALADVLAMGGFKTRQVIASVGGDSSVVVRITEVPKMTGKELEEAIQWELDRQTPFPIDQCIYDYQTLQPADADPGAQNMEVLLAVAQEDMVNAHVDTILSAKLNPVSIDVEPLAIARAVVDVADGQYADQTVGIIHMGATSTSILIVRKGLLSFVRTVPTAGNTLTAAIRQSFMSDEQQSEWVKRQFADLAELSEEGAAPTAPVPSPADALGDEGEDSVFEMSDAGPLGGATAAFEPEAAATQLDVPGVPESAPEPAAAAPTGAQAALDENLSPEEAQAREIIYEAIAPTLVDLATEVRRSIDFYRRQHRNEEIDRLIITGGSAPIKGLDEFMTAETGITASIGNPFEFISADEGHAPARYLADIAPAMVVAVGLALRDMVD